MSDCGCNRCGRCHQRVTLEKEDRWLAPPGMMRPPGIGVADAPPQLFAFGHPRNAELARCFEPFIAAGFSDAEAWAALFSDEQRIKQAAVVYGKRLRKPLRRRPLRAV